MYFFAELEKILFVTGNSLHGMAATPEILSIELYKIQSDYSFLHKDMTIYNDIWNHNFYGMVGMVFSSKVFICGGIVIKLLDDEFQEPKSTKDCHLFSYDSFEWKFSNISMIHSRAFAQSVMFNNGSFFVTGGINENHIVLDSTEYFNGTIFTYGPNLPASISQHCNLLFNETHMIMAGGVQSRMRPIPNGNSYLQIRVEVILKFLILVFILDILSNKWEDLLSMHEGRHSHACGIINYKEIIVAGGKNSHGESLDSVEILTLTNPQWKEGMPLPEKITGAASLQYGSSFMVIGGFENQQNHSNIYQYVESQNVWIKREEKLAIKRASHIAITITGVFSGVRF